MGNSQVEQIYRSKHSSEFLTELAGRTHHNVKFAYVGWDDSELTYTDEVDILYSVNSDGYIRGLHTEEDLDVGEITLLLVPMQNAKPEIKEKYEWHLRNSSPYTAMLYAYEHHLDVNNRIESNLAIDGTKFYE